MVKSQVTEDNDELPDFGIYNDDDNYYKKYQTKQTELDAIYILKAHAPENTEAHANVQSQLNAGKVKFLIDERTAKQKLLATKLGQKMNSEKRDEYLIPFTLTSVLKEEINLMSRYKEIYRKINSLNCEKLQINFKYCGRQ